MSKNNQHNIDFKMLARRLSEWNASPEDTLADLQDLKERIRNGVVQQKMGREGVEDVIEMVPDLELKIIQTQHKVAAWIIQKAELDIDEAEQLELNFEVIYEGVDE